MGLKRIQIRFKEGVRALGTQGIPFYQQAFKAPLWRLKEYFHKLREQHPHKVLVPGSSAMGPTGHVITNDVLYQLS